jgi:transcription termination factor NusB
MKFVIENNNYEWSYFRNKQISKNFVIQLIKFLNENFHLISTKLLKCAAIYRYNHVMKAIVYGVIGEYLMIQSVENTDQKDYKNILINEYILIAEYFLDENHVKLLNGVLEGLFAEMKKVDEIVEMGSVKLDNIEVGISEIKSIFENNNANLIVEKSDNDENKIEEEAICANIMSANIINSNAESIGA